jgi:signal transduction histidine kinase
VNGIDLHAQLISRRKDLAEPTRKAVSQIRDEVRSLMRLILNLLDISRAEEGRLSPRLQEFDVEELVSHVVDALGVRAGNKSVEIRSRVEPTTVYADPELIRRVLENLLDNAIRHAPEESTVEMTATVRESQVEFRIIDQGPGIPKEQRERVFERFVRLEEGARTGHGLGLTFCKLAVEAQGGRIGLDDADAADGTTFWVSLPRTQAGGS